MTESESREKSGYLGGKDKETVSAELLRGTKVNGVSYKKGDTVEVRADDALAMESAGIVEKGTSGIELGRREDEQPGDDTPPHEREGASPLQGRGGGAQGDSGASEEASEPVAPSRRRKAKQEEQA